ncbi:MAG: c-type cytochrome [Anaerolineae bacterium]|nr:c-type cytochrome [Anaerolineae bacterium]
MRKVQWYALPVAALLLLLAMFPLVAGAEPPQDAANGQKVWDTKLCKNCHGPQGEGKYGLPLAGTQKTAADFITQVRTPRQNMPAFDASRISDQEITDIHDYMATLTAPASFTPVRYTPAADDPPGKVLFNQKRCVACHGDFSQTAAGIVKSGRTTLTQADVEKQLHTPRQFMPRFSDTQVTAADAAAITAYLAPIVAQAAGAPAQPAPTQLPTTGGVLPMLFMSLAALAGFVSVAAGLLLRRLRR